MDSKSTIYVMDGGRSRLWHGMGELLAPSRPPVDIFLSALSNSHDYHLSPGSHLEAPNAAAWVEKVASIVWNFSPRQNLCVWLSQLPFLRCPAKCRPWLHQVNGNSAASNVIAII